MTEYHLLSGSPEGGGIDLPEDFFATSDQAAIGHALRQAYPYRVEVWRGNKLLAVVMPGADGTPTATLAQELAAGGLRSARPRPERRPHR